MNNTIRPKGGLVTAIGLFLSVALWAQTPTHFVHEPANAGVNNLFFHNSLMRKMAFIYTQSEWANQGNVTGPVQIDTIWFRHNIASASTMSDLEITLGHTTLSTPVATFASNFNAGPSVQVLNATSYNYTTNAGAFGVPADNWTPIALTTPFTYNNTDNLAVQIEFTNSTNSGITFYADNGGVPITQYASTNGATSASATTARPVFGITPGGPVPPPVAQFSAAPNPVCVGSCVQFTDLTNSADTWSWSFPGADSTSSSQQSPQICYSTAGTYDVELIVSNVSGSDTLLMPGMITVVDVQPQFTLSATALCVGESVTLSNLTPATASLEWSENGNPFSNNDPASLNLNQAGAVTIGLEVTDTNGCVGSDSAQITVTTNPIAGFLLGNNSYCFPDTIVPQNTSGGASGYAWFVSGNQVSTSMSPQISGVNPGSYSLRLVADNQSQCFDTAEAAFTMHPELVADFTWAASVGQGIIDFTYTGSPGISWSWDFGNGAISPVENPTHLFVNPGTYNVCVNVVDSNDCEGQICQLVDVVNLVGLEETTATDFQVYPNPVSDQLRIVWEPSGANRQFRLFNLQGQELWNQTAVSGQLEVDLQGFATGVYILQSGAARTRIVKQ